MSKIISIANQKGGVGKTAATLSLAMETARAGKSTLVIDLDPQNNSALMLDKDRVEQGFYDDVASKSSVVGLFNNVCKPEPIQISDNLFLIGSSKKAANPQQEEIYNLADSLDLIKDEFDVIFLDCPPAVGLIQHGALGISDKLLIISGLDALSYKGVTELINTTRQIKRRVNPELEILGILINKYKKGLSSNDTYEKKLDSQYGDLVLKSRITDTVTLRNALESGRSLREVSPKMAEKYGLTEAVKEVFGLLEIGELA